jgi:proteic killer suppression protein
MNIRSVRHRGLKRFIEDDDGRGIKPELLNRTRNILDGAEIVNLDIEDYH